MPVHRLARSRYQSGFFRKQFGRRPGWIVKITLRRTITLSGGENGLACRSKQKFRIKPKIGRPGKKRNLMKKLASGALLAAFAFVAPSHAQTIAQWTFETSVPATAGPFSPEVGSGSATGSHAGAATFSSPAGNGSSHSFSANTWATGDYYQFQVSTVGFSNIGISYDQTSSNTGPKFWDLQYSTDGVSFTTFVSQYTVLANAAPNNTWSAGTPHPEFGFSDDLSSVAALNNAANVYFRITEDSGTTSANGGTLAPAGTDRVDNFTVYVAPEPRTLFKNERRSLETAPFSFKSLPCGRLTEPHRHDYVEERSVDLQNSRAQFVNQFKENFVVRQRVQRINHVLRIEGDGHFLALVINRQAFSRLSDFRRIGRDRQVVLRKTQLHRIGFLAGHDFRAPQGMQKLFPGQGHAFLGLRRYDLPVIRIIALDELGNDQD